MRKLIILFLPAILFGCETPDYSLSKEIPSQKLIFADGSSLQIYSSYSYEINGSRISISDQDLRGRFNLENTKSKATKNYSPGTYRMLRRPLRLSINVTTNNSTFSCRRTKIINGLRYCYQIKRDEENVGSGGYEYDINGWAKLPNGKIVSFIASKQAEFTPPERVFDAVWTILYTLRYKK